MRIATWNVNSVRARKKRVLAWLETHRPDVVCLQETKVVDEAFPTEEVEALGYHVSHFGQKTYNGVAILSLDEPKDVRRGLDDGVEDPQSRLIQCTLNDVHVLSAYFPNGGEVGSDKFTYKLSWMRRLRAQLDARFDPRKDAVALCGDFNVAPHADDVARPAEFEGTVLACDEVREALAEIADFGLIDVFRPFHPQGGIYSWWDYRGRGFDRNNGLRIDHLFCTERLAERCIGARVDREERKGEGPSDHAPVLAEFE